MNVTVVSSQLWGSCSWPFTHILNKWQYLWGRRAGTCCCTCCCMRLPHNPWPREIKPETHHPCLLAGPSDNQGTVWNKSQPTRDEIKGRKAGWEELRACTTEVPRLTSICAQFRTTFFAVLSHFPPVTGCTVILLTIQLGSVRLGRGSFLPKAEFGELGLELRPFDSKAQSCGTSIETWRVAAEGRIHCRPETTECQNKCSMRIMPSKDNVVFCKFLKKPPWLCHSVVNLSMAIILYNTQI